MPRRNVFWLIVLCAVSLVCYQKVQSNRYGRVLSEAMDQIQRRYLEPVKAADLFEGAMDGMVGRLEDPYSDYIRAGGLEELNETLDQEFGGVGMEVLMDPKTKQLTVISPLVGTPAQKAGIRAGDRILRIDDRSTQGLAMEDAVKLMRGKPGEPVTLSVLHEGEEKPSEIKVVREIIHVDSVLGDRRNSDGTWNFLLRDHERIGYVRISTFGKDTVGELKKALTALAGQEMQGLVLDLRDDPGGLLGAATGVCDLFIDQGEIVSTRGRDPQRIRQVYQASGQGTFLHFPVAVLVNRFSASASEIVAACLQDHQRAVIVGQRTWGKGTVQELIELGAGEGALKLTTASYWRPSKKNIHRSKTARDSDDWGVRPDEGYEVIVEGEALTKLRLQRLRRDMSQRPGNGNAGNGAEPLVDPQLARAIEYILKQLGQEKK